MFTMYTQLRAKPYCNKPIVIDKEDMDNYIQALSVANKARGRLLRHEKI